MKEFLLGCQLLKDLDTAFVSRVAEIAVPRELSAGEQIFTLGGEATHVYIVVDGTVELCLPLSIQGTMRDIVVETQGRGATIGWSAFVKPYRFRLSARAAGTTSLAAFDRLTLLDLIDSHPAIGRSLLGRIAETISMRLLTVQALWARELQRSVAGGLYTQPDAARDGEAHD